jgi:RNA polymerase sigma factor (sigma-70 family)
MAESAQSLLTHQTWLRRLARRLVGSSSAADDLVQETCIAVLRKPPPDEQVRPWLRGVMRRLAWHHVRGERRRARREESFQHITSSSSEPDRLLTYGVDRQRLFELINALPEPFRSTVVQRYLEGLSCAEIARAEGVPAGTVRWRQSRALQLLRSRLEDDPDRPPRRRRPALALAIGTRLGSGRILSAGRSKVAWLALASVAIAIALHLAGGQRTDARRADAATAAPRAAPMRFSSAGEIDETVRAAATDAPGRLGRRGPSTPGAEREPVSTGARERSEAERRRWLEAMRQQYEDALYDCEIDRGVLRCRREAMAQHLVGATCLLLVRSLDALDLGRARRARSPHTRSFLAAAALANLSLATRLGCAIVAGRDRTAPAWRTSGGGSGESEDEGSGESEDEGSGESEDEGSGENKSCETRADDGQECTTCEGAGGPATVCGLVVCSATSGPDGAVCTECTDARGHVESDCEPQEQPDCSSVLREHGLVCTTCAGGAEAECLIAHCGVRDRCLECRDPKGRLARDCSMDYEVMPSASTTMGSGDNFNVCSAAWGLPGAATGSCRYPGTETCRFSGSDQARCIDCTYADGAAASACFFDPTDELTDPMAGRPSTLPAPGTCTTEVQQGGLVECSTCTASDLSAVMACRFTPAASCGHAGRGNPGETCIGCRLKSGGRALVCDSAGL